MPFISISDIIGHKYLSPSQMRGRIQKKLQNGSITLFHSVANNTPAALPIVIEAAAQKGYSFVKVSELYIREATCRQS